MTNKLKVARLLLVPAIMYANKTLDFSNPFFDNTANNNINLLQLKEIKKQVNNTSDIYQEKIKPEFEELPVYTDDIFYISQSDRNYIQETSYNMTTYFRNLYTYSPINNIGSCGYVSLIQALSFYDTFYNDDIIPEQYDRNYLDAINEDQSKVISPGVMRNSYNHSYTYYDFCKSYKNIDLQSKFTMINNFLEGNVSEDDILIKDNFSYSTALWEYQNILDTFYNRTAIEVTTHSEANKYSEYSQNNFKALIKNIIDSGNPAIVHILIHNTDNPNDDYGHHSVVAYDYDENGIYANFGWGQDSTHQLLIGGQYDYTHIYYIGFLDSVDFLHSHSTNYVIDGATYCGCNLSDETILDYSSSWSNLPPTIYWMKDNSNINEYYNIDFSFGTYNTTKQFYSNQITLSIYQWETFISSSESQMTITFTRLSTIDYVPVIYTINKTTQSLSLVNTTFHSTEYQMSSSLDFSIHNTTMSKNDCDLNVEYKGCYINNTLALTLSTRRNYNTYSYLKYHSNKNIRRLDIQMIKPIDEYNIDQEESVVYINYKDRFNRWQTLVEPIYESALSTRLLRPFFCCFGLPYGVTDFQISLQSMDNTTEEYSHFYIEDIKLYTEE